MSISASQSLKDRILLEADEKLTDSILCGLCREILIEPYTCNACVTNFFFFFFTYYARAHGGCVCKEPESSLSPSPKIVLKMLAKRRFSCRNASQGCNEILYYENVSDHEAGCRLRLAMCSHNGCGLSLPMLRLAEHEKSCEFREVPCRFCEIPVVLANAARHEETCPRSLKRCPGCMIELHQIDLQAHTESCDKVFLRCNFCAGVFSNADFAAHDKAACLRKAIFEYRESSLRVLKALNEEAVALLARLKAQEVGLKLVCARCGLFACEAQLSLCGQCRSAFCEGCKKGNGICEECGEILCPACLEGSVKKNKCFLCEQKGGKSTSAAGAAVKKTNPLKSINDSELLIKMKQ